MASLSDRSIHGKEPSIAVDFWVVLTSDQGGNEIRKYLHLMENKPRLRLSFPVHQQLHCVYISTVSLTTLYNPTLSNASIYGNATQ
jgi:hypothetical protein